MLSFGHRCAGESVESTADALEGATFDQPSKLNARGSKALKVTAPNDARLLHHTADSVGERCSGCYLSSAFLEELIADPARSKRVVEAFMKMRKFDIEGLMRA